MNYSDHIINRYRLYLNAKRSKIHGQQKIELGQVINEFKNDPVLFETVDPYLFFCTDREFKNDEHEYRYCVCPELRKVFKWIYSHVYEALDLQKLLTLGVYIRISTDMLNNLVNDATITKEAGIYYHDNLIRNINSVIYALNAEELPF